jgi:phosphatidylglycerophosphatase C
MDLALFDFDGTITTREMLPDFMTLAVPSRRLAIGKVLLAPLIIGYRLGWVSGSVIRAAIVRFGFSRTPLAALQAHGAAFADAVLPGVLRPEALQRIAWHRERGDTVVVVSGGFDVYLEHWCRAHGLELICSALEHRDGRLTGRYRGRQCVRAEKARLVRERYDLARYARIHAYGDTAEDHELLALAHERHYRWERMADAPPAIA